ncbi:NAD(P)-dependent oxidoreductase [bacterium]|nr:NAD(P)-dependent oxidoreductase [bacterium]
MRIMLTGATGFIGSHVAEALRADGHDVTLLVRDPARLPFSADGFTIVTGDLLDDAALDRALDGADAVVHGAAKVGEWGTREQFHHTNVEGTRRLVAACVRGGVRRFVQISSMSVYGNGDKHLTAISEDAPMRKTGMLYGESKVDAERVTWDAHERGEIEATTIRPGMVWGPRDGQFFPKIIDGFRKKNLPYIAGGKARLGLTHVSNAVQIVRLTLEKDAAKGRAYNVDDDDARTFRDLAEAICARLELAPPKLSFPRFAAKGAAYASEAIARLLGKKDAPLMTKMGVYILCYDNDGSVERAKTELDFAPHPERFDERLTEALAPYRKE